MKALLWISFLIVFYSNSICQNVVPFYDNSFHWGLKDKNNHQKIKPIYNYIEALNDTLFCIQKDGFYGLIDSDGNIIVPIRLHSRITIMKIDSFFYNQICGFDTHDDNKRHVFEYFLIDLNCNCHPQNYYPCPTGLYSTIDTSTTSEALRLIQQAESNKFNVVVAIELCKKAIKLEPNNPSLYYYGARLILDNYCIREKEKIKQYSVYYSWVDSCLDKCMATEKYELYLYNIQMIRFKFYDNFYKDKQKRKNAKEFLDINHDKYYIRKSIT